MPPIVVRLDRVQILSGALPGRKPPELEGFKVRRDSFVRCQTTTATYARCREYRSITNDTKIYWQHSRLKGWLAPWKITIVADDRSGLSYREIEMILTLCRDYRFLIVEVAVDFSLSAGVNSRFIRRHAVFGKSRYRGSRGTKRTRYYGSRKSDKFVRCYQKNELGVFRVEVELHGGLLRRNRILMLDDFVCLPDVIHPKHLRIVDFDRRRLKRYACVSARTLNRTGELRLTRTEDRPPARKVANRNRAQR